MVRNGGCWTSAGLFREGLGASKSAVMAATNLMVKRGMAIRHEPSEWGKHLTYSVDHTCRVPDNLTLGDIQEALK